MWPRKTPLHLPSSLCILSVLHTHRTNFADKQNSASPAFYLLLQFLHFLAYVSSYCICLAHFGEQRSHLVSPQEAGSPAFQHVQETGFHNTCKKGKEIKLWVLLSFSLLFGECHLLTPTGQVWSQANRGGGEETDRQTRSQNQMMQARV